MERVLDKLAPLAETLYRSKDPRGDYRKLLEAVREGPQSVKEVIEERNIQKSVLVKAQIIDEDNKVSRSAKKKLHQSFGLATSMARQDEFNCKIVATVPKGFKETDQEISFKKTLSILRRLINEAREEIILVAPFFDPAFSNLIGLLESSVERGCSLLILTRKIANKDSFNSKALQDLIKSLDQEKSCEFVSWEEPELGIHLKTLVVDGKKAYIGSSNFTSGGLINNVELGVVCKGSKVIQIESFLKKLANLIKNRRYTR